MTTFLNKMISALKDWMQITWLICQEIIHHPGLARTTPSAKKCSLIDAVEMSSVTDKDNIIKSFKLLAWQIIDPIIYGVISN